MIRRSAGTQPSFLHSDHRLARAAQPIVRFLQIEAAPGILLVVATVAALIWANSPWKAGYESLWSTEIRLEVGSYVFSEDLVHLINDLLMAVFFFVVGMEIKRELVVGELRDRRAVALPAMAALGGMVVPAMIFLAFNAGGPGSGSESAMPTLWHRAVVLDFVRAGVEERGSVDVVGDSLAELGWFVDVDVRSERQNVDDGAVDRVEPKRRHDPTLAAGCRPPA